MPKNKTKGSNVARIISEEHDRYIQSFTMGELTRLNTNGIYGASDLMFLIEKVIPFIEFGDGHIMEAGSGFAVVSRLLAHVSGNHVNAVELNEFIYDHCQRFQTQLDQRLGSSPELHLTNDSYLKIPLDGTSLIYIYPDKDPSDLVERCQSHIPGAQFLVYGPTFQRKVGLKKIRKFGAEGYATVLYQV